MMEKYYKEGEEVYHTAKRHSDGMYDFVSAFVENDLPCMFLCISETQFQIKKSHLVNNLGFSVENLQEN